MEERIGADANIAAAARKHHHGRIDFHVVLQIVEHGEAREEFLQFGRIAQLLELEVLLDDLGLLVDVHGTEFVGQAEDRAEHFGERIIGQEIVSVDERACLAAAVELYHNCLLAHLAALAYVEGRGLTRATIEIHRLGYAAGGELAGYLRWRRLSVGAALRAGLLGADGREVLAGRVVVPELRAGGPVWLVGRALKPNTDPKYLGLYAAPKELKRPSSKELDALKVEFPETARIPAMAEAMVQIDHHWENLLLIKKSVWKTPKSHPDLEPAHEALQLMEHYRELGRQPSVAKRPVDFKTWLTETENAASALEQALRTIAKDKSASPEHAEKAFQRSRTLCAQCHGKYRDVPQGR